MHRRISGLQSIRKTEHMSDTGHRCKVAKLCTQIGRTKAGGPGQRSKQRQAKQREKGRTSAPVTAHNPTMLGRITAATATQGEGHKPQVARLWPMLTHPTDPGKTNGPVSAHTRTPWRVR